MSEVMWHKSSSWLAISVSIMILMSLHVAANSRFHCSAEKYSIVYLCYIFSIRASLDEHYGSFSFVLLWIMQRLTWKYISLTYWFHLDIYPMGGRCLIIWESLFLILCFDTIVLWFEDCVNVNICFNSKLGKQWV